MALGNVQKLISDHEQGLPFTAHEMMLGDSDRKLWVRFKINPPRFLPKIFDGDWAHTQQHPEVGALRVLRVLTGNDGITRVIARQGNNIYANPWFK